MRQRFRLSQIDMEELGKQANELSSWLEEQEKTSKEKRVLKIPPNLTLVASLTLFNSLAFYYEFGLPPGVICWGGGCTGG
jgi:hypothetical protein